jgi:hypothetical protein
MPQQFWNKQLICDIAVRVKTFPYLFLLGLV